MSEENKFRRDFCKKMVSYGHFSMIESHDTSRGFPDINYCIQGREGNIELKYASPTRQMKIKPSQYRWFKQRTAAGGRAFLMCKWKDDEGCIQYILVHGVAMPQLTHNINTWYENNIFIWRDYIDTDMLALILSK